MGAIRKNPPLVVIPFFVLFSPTYAGLNVLHVSLLHIEVGMLAAALFLLCCALAAILLAAGDKLRTALFAAMAFFIIDISAGGWNQLNFLVGLAPDEHYEKIFRAGAILAVIALLYAALWALREHSTKILAAVFGVMFATALITLPPPLETKPSTITRSERASGKDPRLPIILHLFFDELMAPEAINRELPQGQVLYDKTRESFKAHAFRLYGQAFSRFYWTKDAAAALFNFDHSSLDPAEKYAERGRRPITIRSNAYFADARARGYEIHVYQTQHLDFCNADVARCESFNSYNPLSDFVVRADDTPGSRVLYLTMNLITAFKDSNTAWFLSSRLERLAQLSAWYDADAFPAWFAHVMNQVASAERGTLIFAHFLAPHTPFVWDEECRFTSRVPAHYYTSKTPRDAQTWQAFRITHQDLYQRQTLCLHKQLDALFAMLENDRRFGDALIIIHGDHGSRISRSQYVEYMSEDDLIANHATLFAVRNEGVRPGYDLEFISLQALFSRYLSPMPPRESRDTVVVESAETNRRREVPMPDFASRQPLESAHLR